MQNNVEVFIMNCPPRSGKDTMVDLLAERMADDYTVVTESFKTGLIQIALTVSGVTQEEWDERYNAVHAFDPVTNKPQYMKDMPWDKLGGMSQRNYLIMISEDWVKPVHGKDHFGKLTAKYIKDKIPENNVEDVVALLPDGGFVEELYPLVAEFGQSNVNVFQWGRDGCSFENDSRDYVGAKDVPTVWLGMNDGTIEDFYSVVEMQVIETLNTKG